MGLGDLLPNFDDDKIIPQDESKYRLIKSFLPGVVQRGYNQTEAKRLFRNSGFSFTDQRFGQLYNTVKAAEDRFSTIRGLGGKSGIFESDLVFSNRRFTDEYRFIANFDVDDENISAKIRGSFSIDVSNKFFGDLDEDGFIATKEQIEDEILEQLSNKYGIDKEIIKQVNLVYGFIYDTRTE